MPFPGADLVARLVDSVLALPSFLITLAFTFLYGSAGVAAALFGGFPPIVTSPLGVILAEVPRAGRGDPVEGQPVAAVEHQREHDLGGGDNRGGGQVEGGARAGAIDGIGRRLLRQTR